MTGEAGALGLWKTSTSTRRSIDALGFGGVMRPVSTQPALTTWAPAGPACRPGTAPSANIGADWYQADEQILRPMVKAGADKYLADKKMKRRDPADCQS